MDDTHPHARFAALSDALIARGWLGGDDAPLVSIDFRAPAGAGLFFRAGVSPELRASVEEFVAAWDWTEAGAGATRRAAAVRALLTDTSPLGVALRAFIRDIYTQLNDEREARGAARVGELEIVSRVIAGIGDGLGEPA